MEDTILRRTWAEIDLDALAHNYQTLRRRTGTRFVGVVKADAYGHGSVQVSRVLEELGAELVEFSPLTSRHLPSGAKGLYLGGGYPELYAAQLAENTPMRSAVQKAVASMRESIRHAIENGMPCIAECGGFLYLQEELEDENGVFWPMAGVLSGRGKRASGTGRFGYISLTAEQDTPYLPRGETIAAHEFHRWDSGDNGTACDGRSVALCPV